MNINYESNPGSCARERSPFGATPLKPWVVNDYGDVTALYGQASIQRIDALVASNMELIQPPHTPADVRMRLGDQALRSLHGIHQERIGYHNDNPAMLQYPEQEVLLAAEQGKATPVEMFQILLSNPDMQAIELAKFSSPFNSTSLDEVDMHNAIVHLVEDSAEHYSVQVPQTNCRYKVKRTDTEIPACILSRKRDIAEITTDHGVICIVLRQTLQARGDDAVRGTNDSTEYLHRRTRNAHKDAENFSILTGMIDDELKKPAAEQDYWLQKISTSYYAHYATPQATVTS